MSAGMTVAARAPFSSRGFQAMVERVARAAGFVPASVSLDPLGEQLHRIVQLWVPSGCIDRIKRHLDRRPDADSFETLTIDGHVRHCEQQQVAIVH